ncbi:MAG: PIN domain-containing protein [Deltaproteobacteria bacterium]|nr:PIN domain-containing protein [Deltaproteobacteria bacterium]
MKAFFDTGVYVNAFFKKTLPRDEFEKFFALYDVFLCPIVRHELLLGTVHQKTRRELERFFGQCPLLNAPSEKTWDQATDIMKRLGWRENRQQNDVLIALTAHEESATLITCDGHFSMINKHLDFDLVLLEEKPRS